MSKLKELIPYIIVILLVVLIRTFIITPVRVNGSSMESTLYDGDILLLNKYDESYKRFDIVVLRYQNEKLVKRVVGLPGEKVAYIDNKLYINGKVVDEPFINEATENFSLRELGMDKIPEGYYFVIGDNRDNSLDSRFIGLISEDDIDGKVVFCIFPFKSFGSIN